VKDPVAWHIRTAAVALAIAFGGGCSTRCPDDWFLAHQDGLLPGYSRLKCDFQDYDSGVTSFSYDLPAGVKSEVALDSLEATVSRRARRRYSYPPVTCFERRIRRNDYLLTVCETSDQGSSEAWECSIKGSRLSVTTGGASYVLDFFLSQPTTRQ
jgi:hypothetical protein